jgi:molybdenum ABC transporter molybdate-binding protein
LSSRDKGGPVFRQHQFDPLADADEWGGPTPDVPIMVGAMLKPGVEDAIKQFEDREGVHIPRVYNGCGVLLSQMTAGQPAEMFISCDRSFMEMASDKFDRATPISSNYLVLTVPKGNPKQITELADLARGGLKIGLGHPTNSALGAITERVLKTAGLHDKVRQANMVIEADAGHMLVNQLRAGSLDAAVVYQSNVQSSAEATEQLEFKRIPRVWADQELAISTSTSHRYLLGRLRDLLTSDATREKMAGCGFAIDEQLIPGLEFAPSPQVESPFDGPKK